MTREQVKEIMPYIQAFVDGKTVQRQVKGSDENNWIDMVDVLTFSTQTFNYRIKPEPTYRPFRSAEECWQEMQKHQPFGWVKDKNTGIYKLMTLIGNGEYDYVVGVECGFSLERIFEYYTFADGTPFGMENVIKEEKKTMIQHQKWFDNDRLLVVDEIDKASVQLDIFKRDRLKESYKADCLLWALWVNEASRKKGVAKRLMKAMESYAVNYHCKSIALEYDGRDTPEWVLHWYERLGYEEKAFGNHSSLLVKQLMK